jgi:hypothetical protein
MKKNIEKENLDIIHDLRRSVRKLKLIIDELEFEMAGSNMDSDIYNKLKRDFNDEIQKLNFLKEKLN